MQNDGGRLEAVVRRTLGVTALKPAGLDSTTPERRFSTPASSTGVVVLRAANRCFDAVAWCEYGTPWATFRDYAVDRIMWRWARLTGFGPVAGLVG
jgi:hypothetical protein